MMDLVRTAPGSPHVEVVRTTERLAAIEPAWTALWQRLDARIFQSHAWVEGWWNTLSSPTDRSLRIGLLWQGETLLAVMPLAIGRRKGLRFLEWAAFSYTDYPDVLIAPECTDQGLALLWRKLSASGGFDLVMLGRLLPDAAARRLLDMPQPGSIGLALNHRQEYSYRIGGDWKDGKAWYDSQSKKTRKSYRHGVNVATEKGVITFRLLGPDEPLKPVLQRLSALKRKTLAMQNRQSELFGEETRTLETLVQAMAKAGCLRIFVLECAGVIISISINFVQHDTMMAFVTTYDPDFGKASPGMILMMDYIRWSFDHGLKTVDFLCGAEAFKSRFSSLHVALQTYVGTRTLLGLAAYRVDRGRTAYRNWRGPANVQLAAEEATADAV